MNSSILTTLAFSIYSNKGAYALFLGAGVSKAAGLPSGWDIVTDLLKKLATQNKVTDSENLEEWFKTKYDRPVGYSSVLQELAKTPTERVGLMKPYFEPVGKERPKPTKAHYAIAKLAKNGYLKVILTTNFDRLLETALEEEGITPQVISFDDDIKGATPLVHSDLTVVKINGDYLDCRFRNTDDELESYSAEMSEYLRRIFNEFGLITCGWSAQWDRGLVNIMRSSDNFRYASYFSYVGELPDGLRDIAQYRKGNTIPIEGADSFFFELYERVEALARCDSDHPLTKDIAVVRIKKYIADPNGLIQYTDLFEQEAQAAYEKIAKELNYNCFDKKTFDKFNELHFGAIEKLMPMCITAVRWAKPEHEEAIVNAIIRLSSGLPTVCNYLEDAIKLQKLASLYLTYVVGISCIIYEKYSLLDKVFHIKVSTKYGKEFLIKEVNCNLWIDDNTINPILYGSQRRYSPFSIFIEKQLKQIFAHLFTDSRDYECTFDIFEYFLGINYCHIVGMFCGHYWVPTGIFDRRSIRRNYTYPNNPFDTFFSAASANEQNWVPIKQGMFNGEYSVYQEAKQHADEFLKKYREP